MAFVLVFLAIELAVVLIAACAGGKPERVGSGIVLAMIVVTYVGHPLLGWTYETVDPVGLAVDLIGLASFVWLGLVSRRFWPLWAASLQVLSTGAHLVRALAIPVLPWVYFWMKVAPTLGVLILLMVATWSHRRAEARRRRNSSPS